MSTPAWIAVGVAAWYGVWSLVAFAAYGLDKRAAVRDTHRTPEKTLHTIGLLGGWPGALLAQRLFRHKRRKGAFMGVFWLTVLAHAALWGLAGHLLLHG